METTTMAASKPTRTDRDQVAGPLARNIDELMQRRQREQKNERISERVAARIAAFAGSIWSLLVHAVVFGGWIVANATAVPLVKPWDPSLVQLAMVASVEAIFLTTFVLMNQRRQARLEDDRAELTLHVSMLAEQETTKIADLAIAIAKRLGAPLPSDSDAEHLTELVTPDAVLDEIDKKRPDRS
jgi:uncharacterized membrane protein